MSFFFKNPYLNARDVDCEAYAIALARQASAKRTRNITYSLQDKPPNFDSHWDDAIIVFIARVPLFCKEPDVAYEEMLSMIDQTRTEMVCFRVALRVLLGIPLILISFTAVKREPSNSLQKKERLYFQAAPTLFVCSDRVPSECTSCVTNLGNANIFVCMFCENTKCLECMHQLMCNDCHHARQDECEACGASQTKKSTCFTCFQWLCVSCFAQHECYCDSPECDQLAWKCYRDRAYKFVRLLPHE
jgi:hypothetical protein